MNVEAKNLTFEYLSGVPVLSDLSFAISAGQRVALLGASGCGKTTLLRLIAGLKMPVGAMKGELLVGGLRPDIFRGQGKLSVQFQQPALLPNRDVRWNVGLPLMTRGRLDLGYVDEMLGRVGLRPVATALPSVLSGGMRVRVALARSFVSNPDLILLDEPFASLDVGWKRVLTDALLTLCASSKCTCVFVTHDPQEAVRVAEHVVLLSATGRIVDMRRADSSGVAEWLESWITEERRTIQAGGRS